MEGQSLSAVFDRAEREYAAKEVDENGNKSAKVDNGFFCVEIVKPPRILKRGRVTSFSGSHADLEKFYRSERQDMAELFNESYIYGAVNRNDQGGNSSDDLRTLIWSGGCDSCPVASSGITWVSVKGKDSICVVVKNQDVDKARFRDHSLSCLSNREVLQDFMRTIIHEMEDPSSELHQRFNKCIMKKYKKRSSRYKKRSFAAVSVAPSSDVIHEKSCHEDSNVGGVVQAAIDFLSEEIHNDPAFTHDKTIQTAISAFQFLHKENLVARDILVEFWRKGSQISKSLGAKYIQEHLVGYTSKQLTPSAGQRATNMEVDEHFHRE